MAPAIVLIHSPLVGAGSWEPVAAVLGDCGYEVRIPDLTASLQQGLPYHHHQVEAIVASTLGGPRPGRADTGPVVLAGHSGAGALLPAAGAALGRIAGYVFVDAGLPAPGQSWLQTMPTELADELRGMATDGWLPPWSQWWGPEALAEHLPDPKVRADFMAGCPPLPVAMFEEVQPTVEGWPDAPCAYLRLSEAYDEAAARARALGWPVLTLDSHHLGILTDAEAVTTALLDLLARSTPVL
jgi:hypothetical protein